MTLPAAMPTKPATGAYWAWNSGDWADAFEGLARDR